MTTLQLPCGRITSIDDADAHLLEGCNWYAEKRGRTFYVRGRKPGARKGWVYLHNLLLGGRADHRDSDGLNNSRSNLRPCTQAQNGLNRRPKTGKRFKGVFFDKRRGNFYAQVALAGKVHSSPRFEVEEDAARWHDAKALSLHGEFAHLNFPGPTVISRVDWKDYQP